MKKILFATSDVHGCFDELKYALDQAGFMVGNPNHVLVAVGDFFDRGSQQLEVYEFLLGLEETGQLIYILGNHDFMLINLANDLAIATFNYRQNGLKATVDQIFQVERQGDLYSYLKEVSKTQKYKAMVKWLRTKSLYYETEDYIFAHAGIDLSPNWRKTINEETTWTKTWHMFDRSLPTLIDNKILVCGHWHAYRLRTYLRAIEDTREEFDKLENHKMVSGPYGHFIGIDGCTNITKMVNVLVVEQEVNIPKKH